MFRTNTAHGLYIHNIYGRAMADSDAIHQEDTKGNREFHQAHGT